MLKQKNYNCVYLAPLALWGLFGLGDSYYILFVSAIVLVASWEWGTCRVLIVPGACSTLLQ